MDRLTCFSMALSRKKRKEEEKVKAVKEAREPRTVSETRSFLGLVNYCGRFIPDLATGKRRWHSYGPAKSSIPMCMVCHLILLQITSRWKLFTAQGQNPAHTLKDGCYECNHTNSRSSMSLGRATLLTPSQG